MAVVSLGLVFSLGLVYRCARCFYVLEYRRNIVSSSSAPIVFSRIGYAEQLFPRQIVVVDVVRCLYLPEDQCTQRKESSSWLRDLFHSL